MQPSGIGQSEAILNSQFVALVQVKDRRVVWCNQAFATLFGYSLEELINQPTRQFFPDDESYVAFGQAISTELARASLFHTVVRQRRKSGEICWFEFNCSYLAGSPDTIVGALVDRTANYQLEQALKLNAEILANIKDAVSVVSRDSIIRYANRAFEVMFGYAEGELIGQNVAIVNARTTQSREEIATEIVNFLNAHGYWQGNVLNQRKDGSTFWTEASVTTHDSSDWGHVWISVQRNVTARLALERQMGETNARFREAAKVGRLMAWRMDMETGRFEVDGALEDLLGYTKSEIGNDPARWRGLVHPEDQVRTDRAKQEVITGKTNQYDQEYRLVTKDGAQRWIQVLGAAQRDETGSITMISGIAIDVTDRKNADLARKESEERLEMALMASALAVWDWDIPEHQINAAEKLEVMLGYAPDELPSGEDAWLGLIDPRDRTSFDRAMAAHMQGNTPIFYSEHRLRHKEGHWINVISIGKVTQRDANAHPLRMVGTVQDVSQRKRLGDEGVDLLKRIETLIRDATTSTPPPERSQDTAIGLTVRQRQILGLIASGLTSVEIGKQLHLSTNTVVSHRRNLMAKLDLHTTADVTRFAIDHGLMKK